jgi:RNA polymerase sigma-70 factor (ECF subfamily)
MERSNSEWLAALQAEGAVQQSALAELRASLLGAIRAFLTKIHGATLSAEDARHLAEDCVQETILLVQSGLTGFRGESRFTTWAYSVAVRVVLGELRRRRWRQSAVDRALLGQTLPDWPIEEPGPERTHEQREAWALLIRLIDAKLTPLQRSVLVAHAFQGMPLDEVAAWLGTSRNNLYKLIHDARKRLKQALLAEGVTHREFIALFEESSPTRSQVSGKTSFAQRISS